MPVEGCPQRYELVPRRVLIVLDIDPLILLVSGEDQVFLRSGAHKPLVVVAGRVDEVADDLARRPFAWSRAKRGLSVRDREQHWLSRRDNLAQANRVSRLSRRRDRGT